MLYCEPALIESQPKGSFAAHVRGVTKSALPLKFPFGHMEAMDRMTIAESDALREAMRERYAVHYTELMRESEFAEEDENESDKNPEDPGDPGDLDIDAPKEW